MGSWNPGQDKSLLFFRATAMLLFYIFQRITIPKISIFRKFITIHHCMTLLQVALVSTPRHKFFRAPCWYYRLWAIVKYDFGVVPNSMTSTKFHPNLSIGSRVESCGQTDISSPICVHFMHIAQSTYNNGEE
jgi:hypothetical protein